MGEQDGVFVVEGGGDDFVFFVVYWYVWLVFEEGVVVVQWVKVYV